MALIQVRNITKNYGDFQALKGLSFDIQQGQCLGLLGSNGAGKSTTIKIITGQMQASSGAVQVAGINPSTDPKSIHELLGYIPDSQTLYDEISVEQNIQVFQKIYGQPADATPAIIKKLGLNEKATTKVKKLSKGLRQRVLIARALIHKPQVILLDEPTTGLDPSSAESIYQILDQLKKDGATILLTTHLMNDVERLCDKIVFLNRGQKIEEGTPQQLKKKYRNPRVEVQTCQADQLTSHDLPLDQNLPQSIERLREQGEIYSINSHEPKLEDIFIQLVRSEQ